MRELSWRVERTGGGATSAAGEHAVKGHRELGHVGQHDTRSVSGAEATRRQPVRQSADISLQIAVGERPAVRAIDERGLIRQL
jgi:hypothetical protein